jgi:CheY-like chemotaxis protein
MRVLIAHASEVSRNRLTDVVTRGRRLSLDILTASDGPDALELLLGDDPPEVALIDWDLPGVEAPEMCRLVRDFHHHRDTWLIVLTPAARRASAGEAWKAGADDCVFTPAAPKLLSDSVTKGLCEMAPPIREAAAAAARRVGEDARPRAGDEAHKPTARGGTEGSRGEQPEARPRLDAVRRADDEPCDDEPVSLSADLCTTMRHGDPDGPAELSATPVELAARSLAPDGRDDLPGRATLEAVLARP